MYTVPCSVRVPGVRCGNNDHTIQAGKRPALARMRNEISVIDAERYYVRTVP
jgi:hypothetical protein